MGDQIKALVTIFWFSLVEGQRLELVPRIMRKRLSLSDVILFGGADVEATLSTRDIATALADPRSAVVTRAYPAHPPTSDMMFRWAQFHRYRNFSRTTSHIDGWNLGDLTADAFQEGLLAAAGINTTQPARLADLSSCVMRGLLAPKYTSDFRLYSERRSTSTNREDKRRRPLICMQIRTGKLMNQKLMSWMKNITIKSPLGGFELQPARAGLHSTTSTPRVQDAEMLGASVVNITVDEVPAFIRCAMQIEHALDKDGRWFVTTDSASLRSSMVRSYGSKVLFAPWSPSHTADADASEQTLELTQALDEWRTLADDCDHLIVTNKSSFGLTAAAVAQAFRSASVNLISNARDLGHHDCSPRTQYIEFAGFPMIGHHRG